ncbi:MAG: hypothetical protein ACTSVI_09845 [Promethearchaeota archaeon]
MTFESFEAEFYEMSVPGMLVGKEIIDSNARRIGLCHSLKIRFAKNKKNELISTIMLVIKGLDIEFDIPIDDIEVIGNVIKLKVPGNQADELQVKDVIRLQEDIAGEIRARASRV